MGHIKRESGLQSAGGEMKIYHDATGQCLAERVTLANTFWTRLRGLIGRRRLAPTEALWLRPCNGVHTFWMLFAIDVIFLDRELRVVKLIENLRPFRATLPHGQARSVLELPAHTIARAALKVGDQLRPAREEAA